MKIGGLRYASPTYTCSFFYSRGRRVRVRLRSLISILVPLSVMACVPTRVDYPDWPTTTGKVVDSASGEPIAGATITVRASTATFTVSTVTGSDGGFLFARHTHRAWIPSPPFDVVYMPATLSISAPAHQPFQQQIDSFVWKDGKLDGVLILATVRLTATPSKTTP